MLAKSPQVTTDLFEVARLLEEHGWCQHTYTAFGVGVCLEYAITVACGDTYSLLSPRSNAVIDAIKRVGVIKWNSLSKWNDEPYQTKERVIAVVMRAAATESSR